MTRSGPSCLWSVGYHWSLLRQQAAHPDTLIFAYLDDTYANDEPVEAVACMDTGRSGNQGWWVNVNTLLLHFC